MCACLLLLFLIRSTQFILSCFRLQQQERLDMLYISTRSQPKLPSCMAKLRSQCHPQEYRIIECDASEKYTINHHGFLRSLCTVWMTSIQMHRVAITPPPKFAQSLHILGLIYDEYSPISCFVISWNCCSFCLVCLFVCLLYYYILNERL